MSITSTAQRPPMSDVDRRRRGPPQPRCLDIENLFLVINYESIYSKLTSLLCNRVGNRGSRTKAA